MFTGILFRPAMAIVISILLLFLGVLGIVSLPVGQYPDIAPPTVMVSIAYPGASANVLVDSVIIPLEQSINGVQDMRYMVSSATSAGEATILIYFRPGTDPNINVVNVQNRVNMMLSRLPPLVVREGILVSQVVPSMLMYVNLYSTDPNADQKELYNYANVYIMPELKRIEGMGLPRNLGNRSYAMRIWLNPDRMRAYNISVDDVMKAIAEQSIIGSPGRLGQATGMTSQSKEYVLTYVGRFNQPEQYENIILRANSNGELLRLKDICLPPPENSKTLGGSPQPSFAPVEAVDDAHGGQSGSPVANGGHRRSAPNRRGIELRSEFFDIYSDIYIAADNRSYPACSIVLKQAPGSNAKEVIKKIKTKLKELEKSFPPGVKYELVYDVSNFLDASIETVLHTLLEAFVLVSLVVYMFLGDVRSTLIPILAVPVSLVGTFFFLQLLGLSINLITLFAMVLAIGVVVDDAIVVVEAIHAKMSEKHLTPFASTQEVLHEISGAIIAITLVMTSVFVPVTFMPGPIGQFFRHFGITMATSIVLSGLVALTLTPVLCAMILKPHAPHDDHAGGHRPSVWARLGRVRLRSLLLLVFVGLPLLAGMTYMARELWGDLGYAMLALPLVRKPFDMAVKWVTGRYAWMVGKIVTLRLVTLGVVGAFALSVVTLNTQLPTGFIPGEDQGIVYAVFQTPPGSTLEYTNAKAQELETIAKTLPEVTSITSLAGYEVLTEGRGSNAGTCIINLRNWKDRKRTAREVIKELEKKCQQLSGIKLEFFEPPAVPGFGTAGGISLVVLDKTQSSTADYKKLGEVTEKFLAELEKRPEVKNLFTFYTSNYPQYEVIINTDVLYQKGLTTEAVLNNLNILIGSTYEQGFILFNQFYKVYVQSWPEFRAIPENLNNLFVKSKQEVEIRDEKTGKLKRVQVEGEYVPYSAFMKIQKKQGLNEITRFNMYPCAVIQGAPAAGYSSGQAIKAVQEVARKTLPSGYDISWSGLSYDEAKPGVKIPAPVIDEVEVRPAVLILGVVVVFVYLVLVAQYESFLLPLAVILSLPVGLFGSFLALKLMGLSNDVYAQLGLIMLVGLLGKNAILIVEFAIQRRAEGAPLWMAAMEGAKLRFRPIQMTSFAFITGLLPLVFATGAGAIGNRTIGAATAGGMLIGTVFGVLVIPGLYYIFGKLADGRSLIPGETSEPLSESLEHTHPVVTLVPVSPDSTSTP